MNININNKNGKNSSNPEEINPLKDNKIVNKKEQKNTRSTLGEPYSNADKRSLQERQVDERSHFINRCLSEIKNCTADLKNNKNCNKAILQIFEKYGQNENVLIQQELLNLCDFILFFESGKIFGSPNPHLNVDIKEKSIEILKFLAESNNPDFRIKFNEFLKSMTYFKIDMCLKPSHCESCSEEDLLLIFDKFQAACDKNNPDQNLDKLYFISCCLLKSNRITLQTKMDVLQTVHDEIIAAQVYSPQNALLKVYKNIITSKTIDLEPSMKDFVLRKIEDLMTHGDPKIKSELLDFVKNINTIVLSKKEKISGENFLKLVDIFQKTSQEYSLSDFIERIRVNRDHRNPEILNFCNSLIKTRDIGAQKKVLDLYKGILSDKNLKLNNDTKNLIYNGLKIIAQSNQESVQKDFYDFLKGINLCDIYENQKSELVDIAVLFRLFENAAKDVLHKNVFSEFIAQLFSDDTKFSAYGLEYVLEYLLKLGFPQPLAIVNKYTKDSVFKYLLSHLREKNIISLFKNVFDSKTVEAFEEVKKVKLLGLKIGLDKKFSEWTNNKTGSQPEIVTIPDGIKSLKLFESKMQDAKSLNTIKSCIDLLERVNSAKNLTDLSNSLKADHRFISIVTPTEQLDRTQITRAHATDVVIKNGYLAVCNRGFGRTASSNKNKVYGIQLYRYDFKKLNETQIKNLSDAILDYEYYKIKDILGPRVGYYEAKDQIDTNCSSASLRMGILASFFMVEELSSKRLPKAEDNNLREVFSDSFNLYKAWTLESRFDSFADYQESDRIKAYSNLKLAVKIYKKEGAEGLARYIDFGKLLDATATRDIAGLSIEDISKEINAVLPKGFLDAFRFPILTPIKEALKSHDELKVVEALKTLKQRLADKQETLSDEAQKKLRKLFEPSIKKGDIAPQATELLLELSVGIQEGLLFLNLRRYPHALSLHQSILRKLSSDDLTKELALVNQKLFESDSSGLSNEEKLKILLAFFRATKSDNGSSDSLSVNIDNISSNSKLALETLKDAMDSDLYNSEAADNHPFPEIIEQILDIMDKDDLNNPEVKDFLSRLLRKAVSKNFPIGIITEFVAHNAAIDKIYPSTRKDGYETNALHEAIMIGNLNIVEFLLGQSEIDGVDLNQKTEKVDLIEHEDFPPATSKIAVENESLLLLSFKSDAENSGLHELILENLSFNDQVEQVCDVWRSIIQKGSEQKDYDLIEVSVFIDLIQKIVGNDFNVMNHGPNGKIEGVLDLQSEYGLNIAHAVSKLIKENKGLSEFYYANLNYIKESALRLILEEDKNDEVKAWVQRIESDDVTA